MKRMLLSAAAVLVFAGTATVPLAWAADSESSAKTVPTPPGTRRAADERLARAETLAGLTPVSGPGLLVILRNSKQAVTKVKDPRSLQIRAHDLNEVINALRAGGAEALAVSGESGPSERLLATTGVRETGIGVQIGESRFIPPYYIRVIGDARTLRAELFRDDGAVKRIGLDGPLQMIEVKDVESLELPAGSNPSPLRYARSTPLLLAQAAVGAEARRSDPEVKPDIAKPVVVAEAKPATREVKPAAAKPVVVAEARPATPEVRPTPAKPAAVEAKPAPAKPVVVAEAKPTTAEVKPAPAKPAVPEVKPAAVKPVVVADAKPVVPEGKPAPSKPVPAEVKPAAARPAVMPEPASPARTRPVGVLVPANSTMVFGGKGLAKYHMPGCRFGERIEIGQRESFATPHDAEKAGRVPCRICCPAAN